MKKILPIFLTALGLSSCSTPTEPSVCVLDPALKPRLVVMTDIGPAEVEPDDNESAVRLMAYADSYEIEAIITTVGWNCDPYPSEWAEYLTRVVDAYGQDVPNLMKRSGQTGFKSLEEEQNEPQALGYWPSVEYVRSRCLMGSQRAGIGVIGPDNDTEGSNAIIRLVDEADERPIYFCAWGSANTLAQAIWRVKQERSEEELKAFLHKCRLYTITDQDMQWSMRMQRDYSAHQWLRKEFADDLMLVWDESAWLNQNELGKQNWAKYQAQIQLRGQLGKTYPNFLWGVEGDTPSFLHCMPNGLNDPDDPTQVGWGGVHEFGLSPDSITMAWTNWQQPLKDISNDYEHTFYPSEFNDFAARMQWAAAGVGNHNPVAVASPVDHGRFPVRISAKAGQTVTLDLSASSDPDGDAISFRWWPQRMVDNDYADLDCKCLVDETGRSIPSVLSITIPRNFKGKTIHIIGEVQDEGPFQLVSYKRFILDLE